LPQLEILRKLGCTEMQGYLFNPAIPAVEVPRLFFSAHQKSLAVA
jgi:EAL domain-containing protein (putative c-di-GMP-specific phosphodiesterase class I)